MANYSTSLSADKEFRSRLEQARAEAMTPLSRDEVTEIVHQVIGSLAGDISIHDLKLYAELEALARYIQHARCEIAAIRPDEIRDAHIPSATDELDAVVGATETATNTIMDACDQITAIAGHLSGDDANRLVDLVTQVFEACNFQDITGQRITKVVRTLRSIEAKVEALVEAFGEQGAKAGMRRPEVEPVAVAAAPAVAAAATFDPDKALMNGPQLPGNAIDQDEIDRLLASFD
jgi:chemotaxis protein CheZ